MTCHQHHVQTFFEAIFHSVVFVYISFWVPLANCIVEIGFGWVEEFLRASLRELTALSYRIINGVSGIFVSLLVDRTLWQRHRRAWSDGNSRRYSEESSGLISTLNAIVEREVFAQRVSETRPGGDSEQKSPSFTRIQTIGSTLCRHHVVSNGSWLSSLWRRRAHSTSCAPRQGLGVNPNDQHHNTEQLFTAENYNLTAVSYDRGVLEDMLITLEVYLTKIFVSMRAVARVVLVLPVENVASQANSAAPMCTEICTPVEESASGNQTNPLSISFTTTSTSSNSETANTSGVEESRPNDACDGDLSVSGLIRRSGYPAEVHEVTTSDGYSLRIDRIPRRTKRVVFFVHGILDTSLSWVCTGVTESQAFAAWDVGCDVWLANSRSNPPRHHVDPALQGPAYWHYTVNELGLHDLHAQIEHIHNVKCRELGDSKRCPTPKSQFHLWYKAHGCSNQTSSNSEAAAAQDLSHNEFFSDSAAAARTPGNSTGKGSPQSNSRTDTHLLDHSDIGETCEAAKETTSVFSWLPAGVTEIEQEALELGVQRTGHYFHDSTVADAIGREDEGTLSAQGQGQWPQASWREWWPSGHLSSTTLHQNRQEPYVMTAVGHSLGGAALLMYVVQFRRSGRCHRLKRLVLLTPAGFIERLPAVVRPIAFVLPTLLRITTMLFPAVISLPFFIPSTLLRSLMFRLAADMTNAPALTKLIRSWAAYFLNGDSSAWDQVIRLPHYNKTSMPAVSLLQAKHMLQWVNTGRFSMFDYGSRDFNMAAYGQPFPPDIAAEYWRLDIPVDIAAGKNDGIISPASVKKHWSHMLAAGLKNVTYREFDFGHLDFTFSAKQDLRHHVISCIEKAG